MITEKKFYPIVRTKDHSNVKNTRVKSSVEDRILYIFVDILLIIFVLIVGLPLINIISSSFSSTKAVITGKVFLLPVGFNLEGYKAVFSHRLIVSAYRNTIFYTLAGTFINLVVTMTCAYPLSRKDFPMRNFFTGFFAFTMFFSGGLIPTYILMTQIRFINTIWAMLIPGAMSVYNMILARTFLSSSAIQSLHDAAQIDGCSDASYFFTILLPLSKPIIAVLALYYAVGHWNSYFGALIYLNNEKLYPLQIVLRQILIMNQIDASDLVDVEGLIARQGLADLLKYSLIVVSTAPILCVYPFIQKYFIKGVMIGSIKG
jgi:putative aldouronate transport system permease protein